MKNFGDYHYFYYVGNNVGYSFRNYTDPKTGMERGYVIGYDRNRMPVLKNWEFDNGTKRQIRVHKDEKDKEGQLAVEFLRESPECYQSENGKYLPDTGKQVAFLFREVNEGADATNAVATRSKVILAQSKALELKGEALKEFAEIIGVFVENDAVRQHRVLDFASNFPDRFNALMDDPARPIKALIKKAINDNIFKVNGKMILWEGKQIGADEDDAVATLQKDDKLMSAIKLNLKKFGS